MQRRRAHDDRRTIPLWLHNFIRHEIKEGVLPHRASSSTRQSHAKCRAMRSDWRYRQCSAMSFDDQPANCQPHPHAIGLCREERVKDMVDVFLLYAGARIFDRNLEALRVE
jgi:hypothetical protein